MEEESKELKIEQIKEGYKLNDAINLYFLFFA